MKRTGILSIVLFSLSGLLSAQSTPWTFEVSSGYDLGIGQAISWTEYGKSDSSYTYYSKTRDSVGNTGFHGEIRGGYDLLSNVGMTVAASILVGMSTLKSGYAYDTAGNVSSSWAEAFNYATIRVTPAARFWIISSDSFRLYSSLGPTIIIASPINETSTNTVNSKEASNRYFYGLGYGAQGEVGAEYSLGRNWGFTVACALEKISLPRTSIESEDISGNRTNTSYSEHPATNSNGQTAGDVANSNSTQSYYSYPTVWDDFSDLSLKLGFIWHL